MRRSVENDQKFILPFEQFIYLGGEIGQIEFQIIIEQLKRLHALGSLHRYHVVIAPEPIGSQHVLAALGVIGDRMMNRARAARRRQRFDVSIGLIVGEREIDSRLTIFGQPVDGRVSSQFPYVERTINFVDGGQDGEFAFVVEHNSDRGVGYAVGSIYFNRVLASLISLKDRVVQSSVLSVTRDYAQCNQLHFDINRNQFTKKNERVNAARSIIQCTRSDQKILVENKKAASSHKKDTRPELFLFNRWEKIRCGWH